MTSSDSLQPAGTDSVTEPARDSDLDREKLVERVKALRAELDTKVQRRGYLFYAIAASLLLIWINMIPLHLLSMDAATDGFKYIHSWKEAEGSRNELLAAKNELETQVNRIRSLELQNRELENRGETKQLEVARKAISSSQKQYFRPNLNTESPSNAEMERLRASLANDQGQKLIADRLAKWGNPTCTWYRYWKNRQRITWNKLVF
jgi:hypothetical protein